MVYSRTIALSLAAIHTTEAADFTAGCLVYNYKVQALDTNPSQDAASTELCQSACAAREDCATFSYWPQGTSPNCWLGKVGPYEYALGAISGPKVCKDPSPACTETPSAGFPGTTAEASNAAWPETGHQPTRMQCYPMSPAGIRACPSAPRILADVSTGWPGTCENLTKTLVPQGKSCESLCMEDVTCPSWQLGFDGSCWQGVGANCWSRPAWNESFAPKAAQRIMHGTYRVLKMLAGVQVMNLQNVFNKANLDVIPGTIDEKAARCRDVCLSITLCEYWQLNSETGCWVEDKQVAEVAYPLTKTDASDSTPSASKFVRGEYIQRLCPAFWPTTTGTTTTTTTTTEAAGGMPWWGWFLISLALFILCCCCGPVGILVAMGHTCESLFGKNKRAPRATRAVKRAAAPLVPTPVPTVAVPTSIYTYAAPPAMTYQAPVSVTNAAPPAMTYQAPVSVTNAAPPVMTYQAPVSVTNAAPQQMVVVQEPTPREVVYVQQPGQQQVVYSQ